MSNSQAAHSTGFSTKHLAQDLMAGLTKAIESTPGGMANAVLAGVNPVYGLFTAMIATPVAALFTGSVFMNVDSTSALALMAGSTLLVLPAERRGEAIVVLTILVGLAMLLAGLLRLGFLIRFVSNSVMTGFVTGVALLIVLGQLGDLTGYTSDYQNKVARAMDTLLHLDEIDLPTLAVGLVTLGVILLLDRTRLNKVSLLAGVVIGSALAPLLGWDSVVLVSDVTPISGALPRPVLPDLSLLPSLIVPAISIAIVGLVQSASISQTYANPDRRYPDVSRDFAGQGVANVAAGLFNGIPAGGSLSGTALLVKGGAASRWANLSVGLMVALVVLLFSGLVGRLAMASLAGVLILSGIQAIPVRQIETVWNTGLTPRALMLVTFGLTLIVPLQWAVFIGVALSFVAFVVTEAERVALMEVKTIDGVLPQEVPAPRELPSNQITILRAEGNLFFAGARNFEEDLPIADDAHNAVVMLSLAGHHEIGSTLINVLDRYADTLERNGGQLMLMDVDPEVYAQLDRTELLDDLGPENVFVQPTTDESMAAALARAQALVQAPPQEATPA